MSKTMRDTTITFIREKDTKNTVRYAETNSINSNAVIGMVYVQKHALPSPIPQSIKITLSFPETEDDSSESTSGEWS